MIVDRFVWAGSLVLGADALARLGRSVAACARDRPNPAGWSLFGTTDGVSQRIAILVLCVTSGIAIAYASPRPCNLFFSVMAVSAGFEAAALSLDRRKWRRSVVWLATAVALLGLAVGRLLPA